MSDTVTFTFDCKGSPLLGFIHQPTDPVELGILIVVGGGPQYRAGGHRQLLLWSREFAKAGFSVMRFDYRGMGDSGGLFAGFEHINDDLDAAITAFKERCPHLRRLVLWGECDASSAIMMYASSNPMIEGIALQNPWARTEQGEAKTYIKHYYVQRLLEREFWRKVARFDFNPWRALNSLAGQVNTMLKGSTKSASSSPQDRVFLDRMKIGMQGFEGHIFLLISGHDLIAKEFVELLKSDKEWTAMMSGPLVTKFDIEEGDHTFSSAKLRHQVVTLGIDWMRGVEAST